MLELRATLRSNAISDEDFVVEVKCKGEKTAIKVHAKLLIESSSSFEDKIADATKVKSETGETTIKSMKRRMYSESSAAGCTNNQSTPEIQI